MALVVHRATRADVLADGLAELLAEPLADPFAQELVLVPAKGVERWLSQRLSHRLGAAPGREDGVCAGVELRNPASLVSELLGAREDDPWAPDALVWPLLEVVDASLDEPWARVLARHLGHGVDDPDEAALRRGRRYAVARRLAALFASYAVQRPTLLVAWEAGQELDGAGAPLDPDLAWQPRLWQRLVAEVARRGGGPSPVRRHADAVAGLRDGAAAAVPSRLSLFGHTRTSRSEAELLAALGEHHDVHLWVPHPSDALWRRLRGTTRPGPRAGDRSHLDLDHPLLSSMARDVRELQGVLEEVGAVDAGALPEPSRPETVLGRLQDDVEAERAPVASGLVDDSVQVHACHGPARQVEVLREVVLDLLTRHPDLEPRDVLVMCPDIETYAPLITGAFGLGDAVAGSHPGHRLRVMLADRSPTQTNPLLAVLADVLDLADGRAEATRVLDLLALAPVRRRFGLRDDDLETLTTWVSRSGVRWAWDAAGRERFGLAAYQQNTWRFGLDRVLAGVALSDDSRLWLGATLPLDDVSTTDIALAGRAAEAVDRLQRLTTALTGVHPASHWVAHLVEGVSQVAAVAPGDEWQLAQLRRALTTLAGGGEGAEVELRLPDVRALLHSELGGRPTRAGFRTGTLTVCTMTPMRSVPHRVVCLLGVDDGVFPRGGALDGDDVLARSPLRGERDVRSQDRQLFLDALMSARDHLVITYTGFSEATGHPRPPAVPLRELLDVVERTTTSSVVREHRSQAHHPDYFAAGSAFSFDQGSAAAALASCTSVRPRSPHLADLDLPPRPVADVELRDLLEAVVSPTRAFLRRRLEVDLPRESDEVSDAMPVELAGLEQWAVGDRVLGELLRGRSVEDAVQLEWRRGTMPPGRLGWRATQQLARSAYPLQQTFESSTQGAPARTHDIEVDLGGGRRLVGTVAGVHDHRIVRVGFGTLRAKQRLETWVSLVALSAATSPRWVARAIGRGEDQAVAARATYDAPTDPAAVLADLVALHDLAMTRAVPMLPETGRLWARSRSSTKPAWMLDRDLADAWRQESRYAVELAAAWGRAPTWAQVVDIPGSGPGTGSGTGSGHLLGEQADRVWAPALAREVE